MSNTTPVSMRLTPRTVSKVNYIEDAIDARNRTEAVAEAIRLAAWWLQKQEEGAKIYAEYPDGEREVVVTGLEPPNHNGHKPPKTRGKQR